jgi:hypothetical protein
MRLSNLLELIEENEDTKSQAMALLQAPLTPIEELRTFKDRVLLKGIDRTDVIWLNINYTKFTSTPLDVNQFTDAPTQIGLSDALGVIQEIETCLMK